MDVISRHKWKIIRYIGSPIPVLSSLQKTTIHKQLDKKYCHQCGEYIYNPYRKRKIRHYHNYHRCSHHYKPLMSERIVIHNRSHLVEWTRRFPNVMRLIISTEDIVFYNNIPQYFVHRIPALRMWTIEEWNMNYPEIRIQTEDGLRRLLPHNFPSDPMFIPSLVL